MRGSGLPLRSALLLASLALCACEEEAVQLSASVVGALDPALTMVGQQLAGPCTTIATAPPKFTCAA